MTAGSNKRGRQESLQGRQSARITFYRRSYSRAKITPLSLERAACTPDHHELICKGVCRKWSHQNRVVRHGNTRRSQALERAVSPGAAGAYSMRALPTLLESNRRTAGATPLNWGETLPLTEQQTATHEQSSNSKSKNCSA